MGKDDARVQEAMRRRAEERLRRSRALRGVCVLCGGPKTVAGSAICNRCAADEAKA